MKHLKEYKIFESNSINFDKIKQNLEDILLELNDEGLDTSVYCYDSTKYKEITFPPSYKKEWHSQIDFIEIMLSSKERSDIELNMVHIFEVARRISVYLADETGNKYLNLEEYCMNNTYVYMDDGPRMEYAIPKYIFFFGFTMELPYAFWHHSFANKYYNHL